MNEKNLMQTREDIIAIGLKDFLAIVIDTPENVSRRIDLVGKSSELRSFLITKLTDRKKEFQKNFTSRKVNAEVMEQLATKMWSDIKTKPDFFKAFVPKKSALKKTTSCNLEICKRSPKQKVGMFSIRDVFKFSLTSNEIRILFGIEPWRFVAFHIFRECYPDTSFTFEKLFMEMPHFDPRLVDFVMKGENAKILSKNQNKKLSRVLKGEASENSLFDLRNEFAGQIKNCLTSETFEKIVLGNVFLARIINKHLGKQVSPESLDSKELNDKSVAITFLKNKERLDWQFILQECPLWKRCEKIVEIFSKNNKTFHLSCLQCPQLIHARSRLRQYDIATRNRSSLHNCN